MRGREGRKERGGREGIETGRWREGDVGEGGRRGRERERGMCCSS